MNKNFLSDYLCRPPTDAWKHCIEHYCPACNELHLFAVDKPFNNGAQWSFDGNAEKPTFSPSMNYRLLHIDGPDEICHYFLRGGTIQYLTDCTHKYKGKTIPLPKIPERYKGAL